MIALINIVQLSTGVQSINLVTQANYRTICHDLNNMKILQWQLYRA